VRYIVLRDIVFPYRLNYLIIAMGGPLTFYKKGDCDMKCFVFPGVTFASEMTCIVSSGALNSTHSFRELHFISFGGISFQFSLNFGVYFGFWGGGGECHALGTSGLS